jgi:uncharacterized membrane protein YtjA (UPF0391 family)
MLRRSLYAFGKASAPQLLDSKSRRRSRVITAPIYGWIPDFNHREDGVMLRWALIFFVVALLAAVLGFTGIALAAAGIAKILFYVFVILFALSLLSHVARRP